MLLFLAHRLLWRGLVFLLFFYHPLRFVKKEEIGENKKMEEKINKIGVSVPNKLLIKFDGILESRGYSTRSDAIRELVRNYVDEYNDTNNIENGKEIGTINYFYDTIQSGIGDDLSLEYHRYRDIVIASSHVHINETSCFEMATVRGNSGKIRNLMGALMGIKGVTMVKLVANKLAE